MAGTVTVATNLTIVNAGLNLPKVGGNSYQVTQTNQGVIAITHTCTSAAGGSAISTTGLTTLGWAYFYNPDASINIHIGHWDGATLHPVVTLKPTESCLLRLYSTVSLRAISASGTPKLLGYIAED